MSDEAVPPVSPIQPVHGVRKLRAPGWAPRWGRWRRLLARDEARQGNWQAPAGFAGHPGDPDTTTDEDHGLPDRELRREMEREATDSGHRLDLDA